MAGTTRGLRFVLGDILDADVEAFVNTVNTAGVMGKGVALQLKRAYPENFKAYKRVCDRKELKPGEVFVWRREGLGNPRFIFNVATKKHWRQDSRMEYVEDGLANLHRLIVEHEIRSIAIPPLGAGSGNLPWPEVKRRMEAALRDLKGVDIAIYTPRNEPPKEGRVATKKPRMTVMRAFVPAAIDAYAEPTYPLGRLELQKLAYFLQRSGAPLGLDFKPDKFGPFSNSFKHVLGALEGHYISGLGDLTRPSAVHLLPNAEAEAKQVLRDEPAADRLLARLVEVIEGYESPYGLELLSSVDWVMSHGSEGRHTDEWIVSAIQGWDHRKASLFAPEHIKLAAEHLRQVGVVAH